MTDARRANNATNRRLGVVGRISGKKTFQKYRPNRECVSSLLYQYLQRPNEKRFVDNRKNVARQKVGEYVLPSIAKIYKNTKRNRYWGLVNKPYISNKRFFMNTHR